jgi:hypothetical protein
MSESDRQIAGDGSVQHKRTLKAGAGRICRSCTAFADNPSTRMGLEPDCDKYRSAVLYVAEGQENCNVFKSRFR